MIFLGWKSVKFSRRFDSIIAEWNFARGGAGAAAVSEWPVARAESDVTENLLYSVPCVGGIACADRSLCKIGRIEMGPLRGHPSTQRRCGRSANHSGHEWPIHFNIAATYQAKFLLFDIDSFPNTIQYFYFRSQRKRRTELLPLRFSKEINWIFRNGRSEKSVDLIISSFREKMLDYSRK